MVNDDFGHAGNHGLDNVTVIEALDDCRKKDDCRQDRNREGLCERNDLSLIDGRVGTKDELTTFVCVAQKVFCLLRDELENIIPDRPANDEESEDVLHEDSVHTIFQEMARRFYVTCMRVSNTHLVAS